MCAPDMATAEKGKQTNPKKRICKLEALLQG